MTSIGTPFVHRVPVTEQNKTNRNKSQGGTLSRAARLRWKHKPIKKWSLPQPTVSSRSRADTSNNSAPRYHGHKAGSVATSAPAQCIAANTSLHVTASQSNVINRTHRGLPLVLCSRPQRPAPMVRYSVSDASLVAKVLGICACVAVRL